MSTTNRQQIPTTTSLHQILTTTIERQVAHDGKTSIFTTTDHNNYKTDEDNSQYQILFTGPTFIPINDRSHSSWNFHGYECPVTTFSNDGS